MLLEEKVQKILIRQKKTLAVAESCSGGLLSHKLTNIPGSSSFFMVGLVTYSNGAKTRLLNIPPKILTRFGAVSEEVSTLMAQNVRKLYQTDIGVAITGIAGPTGQTKNKPTGLTYISIADKKKTTSFKFIFKGIRTKVKTQAAQQALKLLLKHLK